MGTRGDEGVSIQSIGVRHSADHLKLLHRKLQIPFRNFKWVSGTGINKFASARDFPKFADGAC